MAETRSAQFIGMLEALRLPAQFQRGRRYVRAGQVRQLTISANVAVGLVLDEDGRTRRARIAVRGFSEADWYRIERAVVAQASYAASLLAGDVPAGLDTLLRGLGLSLLPESLGELAMDCSCEDWQVPCRHLAATCYALAESFDRDPFGILAWRGRQRDALLGRLRALRAEPARGVAKGAAAPRVADFWTGGPRARPETGHVAGRVRRADALLAELDPLRLAAGRHDVTDLLRAAYRQLAQD